MRNVELIKGKCAICRGPIDKEWAGEDPSLGTRCRNCSFKNPEQKVFGRKNVEINVKKQVVFDPLFGRYEYHFDWKGSRIMVNGKVGTIVRPQGDGDFVRFEGEETGLGTFIKGVGYWDLLRIYKARGGDATPPPLSFPLYVPEKAELLTKPTLRVNVDVDERQKTITSVWVGENRGTFTRFGEGPEPPVLTMLHAFTNLYVRYKFGLAPNYICEGGFIGKNFEVRNGMFGPVAISVRTGPFGEPFDHVRTPEDFLRYDTVHALLGQVYECEQSRPEVLGQDADATTVLSTWMFVMTTLLRYDWRREPYETIADVWQCYCRMQDILLNIMPIEELQGALDYARKGEMKHAGRSF